MSVTADLITILNATSAVTALTAVNLKTGTKAIRPSRLDSDDQFGKTLAGIELHVDGSDYQNDLESSGGTSIIRVMIDCVSQSAGVSNSVANQVEKALEPFRGATAGGFIDAIELVDRREDWGSTEDGRSVGEYVVTVELSVFYRAS